MAAATGQGLPGRGLPGRAQTYGFRLRLESNNEVIDLALERNAADPARTIHPLVLQAPKYRLDVRVLLGRRKAVCDAGAVYRRGAVCAH